MCWVRGLCGNSCWWVRFMSSQVNGIRLYGSSDPTHLLIVSKWVNGWPSLTWNSFTINPNPLISCWVHVEFTSCVKQCHPYMTSPFHHLELIQFLHRHTTTLLPFRVWFDSFIGCTITIGNVTKAILEGGELDL